MQTVMQQFQTGSGLDQLATTMAPYMDKGAAWRWKADAPGEFNAESADRLRQAQAVKTILRPLTLKISVVEWGPGIPTATLNIGGTSHEFTPDLPAPTVMRWNATGDGMASLIFPGQPRPYEGEGDWALLHLLENAKVDTAGASAVRVRFGGGASTVVFRIEYPAGVPNPFSGGPWAFRCPSSL
jgi:type VI protein secretion system component VasK